MSSTIEIARRLREIAREALAATRLDALELPPRTRTERRGDAFAASLELDDDYDSAAAALAAQYGVPKHAGTDPTGVRWLGHDPPQSFGVLILVERDGAAVLHLEPFGRKTFTGIEPDVARWFAARGAATSRTSADVAEEQATKRAARKAAGGPPRGGRLTPARVKKLAGWFAELGAAPLDRAAIERFAAANELVLDDDDPFAGRTYLTTALATRLQVHIRFTHVMTILAESDGEAQEEDALVAAAHDRRHAALRGDLVDALGDPAADGRYTYISTDRWTVWRTAEAVIALVTGMDPRGDGGHASALRIVTWPHDRALPVFDQGASAWFDDQCKPA